MHAIKKLPKFDHLLLLQPTSPLRTTDDLTEAITLASVNDFFSVISVSRTHPPLEWALEIAADGSISRAISDKGYVGASRLTYTPNGAVYLAERDWLQREVTLLGQGTRPYIMPPERSVDIDTEFDWQVAEMVMERRQSGKNFGDWR